MSKFKINNLNLKSITIFDPQTNARDSVLFDTKTGMVLGFNELAPYYAAGGAQMIIDNGGLVEASEVYGFECWHCCDNTYRLGKAPVNFRVKDTKRNVLMSEGGKPYAWASYDDAKESANQWQFADDNDNLEHTENRFIVVEA